MLFVASPARGDCPGPLCDPGPASQSSWDWHGSILKSSCSRRAGLFSWLGRWACPSPLPAAPSTRTTLPPRVEVCSSRSWPQRLRRRPGLENQWVTTGFLLQEKLSPGALALTPGQPLQTLLWGLMTVVQSLGPSGPLTVKWSSSGRDGQCMLPRPPWPQFWAGVDSSAGALAERSAPLPPGR